MDFGELVVMSLEDLKWLAVLGVQQDWRSEASTQLETRRAPHLCYVEVVEASSAEYTNFLLSCQGLELLGIYSCPASSLPMPAPGTG